MFNRSCKTCNSSCNYLHQQTHLCLWLWALPQPRCLSLCSHPLLLQHLDSCSHAELISSETPAALEIISQHGGSCKQLFFLLWNVDSVDSTSPLFERIFFKLLHNYSVTQPAWLVGKTLFVNIISIQIQKGRCTSRDHTCGSWSVDNAASQAAVFIHRELRHLCT